jgi:hypothetical protein
MPRVALPDSLQLCRISGCLYTPSAQDQHYFAKLHRCSVLTTIEDLFMRCAFEDLAGYPRILYIVNLRPL